MNKALVLIGWRRSKNSVALFQTWHTYAVLFIAMFIGVVLYRVL